MGLFGKKKNDTNEVLDNKHALEEMTLSIDILLALCKNEDFAAKLRSLQEKLKYSNPTSNPSALAIDKKLAAVLGDMKIEMTKTREWEDIRKLEELLTDASMHLAERNVYANSKVRK